MQSEQGCTRCGINPAIPPWEEALRLHSSGMGYKKISKFLGISQNTVKSWLRRYGDGTRRLARSSGMSTRAYEIKTIADWSTFLSQAAQNFHCTDGETATYGRPVIFVCGAIAVNKGADILSAIIEHKLRMDPFSGDIFGFCGRSRDRIRLIHWDGSGFHVVSRRKERGTYFWPPQRLGQTITVSAREFEYILRGSEG